MPNVLRVPNPSLTDDATANVSDKAFTIQAADPPSVVSIVRANGAGTSVPASASSVSYTVEFSSSVTSVDVSDFSLSSTGTASGSITAVSGSGSTYTVTVNGLAGDGTLRLDLRNSGTGIKDGSDLAIAGGYTSGSSYTLDHTAPTTVPDTATFSADTGASSSDFITNTAAQTISGTLSAGLVSGESVQVSLDAGLTWADAVASQGAWSLPGVTLTGSNTLLVRVADAAGNARESLSRNYVLDVASPSVSIASDHSVLAAGQTATITFTFSEDPGASFTWGGASGDVSVSGGNLSGISGTGAIRTATFTPNAGVNDGAASITVAAGSYVDLAGNSGGGGSTPNLTIDTLAPATAIASLHLSSDTGKSDTDFVTNTALQTISGTLSGGLSPGECVGLSLDNGASWNIITVQAGQSEFSANVVLVGAGEIQARVMDAAGNGGPVHSQPYTLDVTVPVEPSAPTLTASDDTGSSSTDSLTRNATPTFSGTADAGVTVMLYDTDGATVLGSGTALGDGTYSIASAALSDGSHSITAKASDLAGNVSSASSAQSVYIDTAPSTLTVAADKASLKVGETAEITFTFSEDPGASFSSEDVTVSGGTLSSLSGTGLTRIATFTPAADINDGTASITVPAGVYADVAGNLGGAGSSPSLTFDTLAPAAPSALTLASASDTGASATDGITSVNTPTVTGTAEDGATVRLYDTDGTTVLGTTTAAAGVFAITSSNLADGSHTLSVRATDATGNVSSASSGLSVAIDRTAPTATITVADATLTTGETSPVTFTFSEAVTGFTNADLTVQNGTLSTVSSADHGITWTATLTPSANTSAGTNAITLVTGGVEDVAGNAGSSTTSNTYAVATLPPDNGGGTPPTNPAPPGEQTGGTGTSLTTTSDPNVAKTAADGAVQSLPASVDKATITDAVASFLAGLPAGTSINVSTFTPTPGASTIAINGPTDGTQTLVVLDASAVPPGTPITLNNVSFVVLAGPASLVGGDGSQVVFGDAAGQSMVLGAEDDTLHGGGGADYVGSRGGNDMLYGDAGIDTVSGGIGNDTLFGGADQDLVYGNQDNDVIYGNLGADTLYGGQGSDTAFGGQGNDGVSGNLGNDVLSGNLGSDIVYGNQGDDIVYGNQGDDLIFGGRGNDVLFGGQGNDVLTGGVGNDMMTGGLGADTYVFGANSGRDLILGFSQAQGDKLSFGGQTFTSADDGQGGTLFTLSGGGTVDLAGVAQSSVTPAAFA